jgi:xylulose-5-phosphate/fructose-6-phosphate phosphoketolase
MRRVHRQVPGADELVDLCRRQLDAHTRYIREHFEDLPEIRDWAWTPM